MNLEESRRRQYLAAMDIPLWERRTPRAVDAAVVPATAPPAATSTTDLGTDWQALQEAVRSCTQCGLHKTRTQTVFGVGDPAASWMFIGEAPGADEDKQGEPFVGRAGQLLNAMLFAMGLKREEVYIANVLKCRPPGNRDPQPEEVAQCEPYLIRQIEHIRPKLIVALGRHAAHSLLKTDVPLARLRGQRLSYHGIPLIVTYHPAYLLRSPGEKRKAWDDLMLAKNMMVTG
ncbi:MAG: uracil-DNA glycosylase [Pseudomonadota bacterium]